jgi:hypothetical protein
MISSYDAGGTDEDEIYSFQHGNSTSKIEVKSSTTSQFGGGASTARDSDWYSQSILEDTDDDVRGNVGNSLYAATQFANDLEGTPGTQKKYNPFDVQDDNGIESEIYVEQQQQQEQEKERDIRSRDSYRSSYHEDEIPRKVTKQQQEREMKLKANLVEVLNRLEDAGDRIRELKMDNDKLRTDKVDLEKKLTIQSDSRNPNILDIDLKTLKLENMNLFGLGHIGAEAKQTVDLEEYADGRMGKRKFIIRFKRAYKWLMTSHFNLFSKDCAAVEARFGGGVAAYFKLFRWQAIVGVFSSIIVLIMHIPHLILYFKNVCIHWLLILHLINFNNIE